VYVIVLCPRCRRGQVARKDVETQQCRYCMNVFQLSDVKLLYETWDVADAHRKLGLKTGRRCFM
jgi:hypothetical protein